MHCVTKAMLIYLIDGKCDIKFNQSHHIINVVGGGHTHTQTHRHRHTHTHTKTHTYTHVRIPMPQTKAISRNQAHAWCKRYVAYSTI